MKITPLDIKKQEFEIKFRGFDKVEVISFLEMISEEMENLIRENLELKEKLQRATEKLTDYTKIESALQNTLMATQESAEQMKTSAKEKAELIIREANSRAEKILSSNYDELSEMRHEYLSLRNQRAAFLVNFRSLLESQLKLLELMEKQSSQENKTLILKKKTEMSDSDVDKVVEEFQKDHEPAAEENAAVTNRITEEEQTQSSEGS